jgi:hypothetical protein
MYGDRPIRPEQLLAFDEETWLVTLGGLFSEHQDRVAWPPVLAALKKLGADAPHSEPISKKHPGVTKVGFCADCRRVSAWAG